MSIVQQCFTSWQQYFSYFVKVIILYAVYGFFSQSIYAYSCWYNSSPLNFGTVNASGSSTATTNIFVTCNNDYQNTLSYKICLAIDPGMPSGINPRRMLLYYPEQYLNYNLYYNPAATQLIPTSTDFSNIQCYDFSVTPTSPNSFTIPIYGKVLAGQSLLPGNYIGNNISIQLLSAVNIGTIAPTKSEALVGSKFGHNGFNVNANYDNSCLIVSATNVNFGTTDRITTDLSATGDIQINCPTGTSWQIALNGGMNSQGQQRRMKNAHGDYLNYNLYKNNTKTDSWQPNTFYPETNPNIRIYGAVPIQSISSTGQYSDTVTITLTY